MKNPFAAESRKRDSFESPHTQDHEVILFQWKVESGKWKVESLKLKGSLGLSG
ncbi:MAG: hypothetical protein ITG00_02420 [Flavobacterium sp.]|nr:hypothetical protein [Flavobacterium sp.]